MHGIDPRLGKVKNISTASIMPDGSPLLIVDDSITVREMERKILQSQGYDVSVASDGIEGCNLLNSEPFDLVVSDIDMPRMDGIEFIKTIRKLPVVVVSYKDRLEDRQRGLDAGANFYLEKGSYQDDKLIQAVRNLIDRGEK